jgi:tetratricopeptide (TPR) repeat protein
MAKSVFERVWDVIKPPPAVGRPGAAKKKLSAKQKRLLKMTLGAIVVLGGAWSVYAYIAAAPQRADKEYQAGVKLMGPARYKEAIDHFSRAVDIWPQLGEAYLQRGIAHHYLNEDDEAIADYFKTIDINPRLARAYSGLGSIYRARGDARKAIEQYTKSVEIESNVDAYYERGQTYESLGDHQKAIDDYNRAIAEMPDAPFIYLSRGAARRNLGDMDGFRDDQKMARSLEHR